jgi:DNA polymerase III subunit delta'
MPFSKKIEAALDNFRRAFAAGRMPHALMVSGHPRGAGSDFAEALLGVIFDEEQLARLRQHVDIQWVEPESKSRQIKVDEQIRPLIDFFSLTSYAGGWKAAVILFADRMNQSAQNALLKTLEEPPPHSLLILVTDTPAALLPTIRSRSQYVDVTEDDRLRDAVWVPVVMDLLRNPPLRQATEMISWTDRLTKPLRELEELAAAEEEERAEGEPEGTKAAKEIVEGRIAARKKEMREEILRTIQLWQRDVLARATKAETVPENFPEEEATIAAQAEGLSFADAATRVAVVDEVRELLEHNIREATALPRMARAFSKAIKAN